MGDLIDHRTRRQSLRSARIGDHNGSGVLMMLHDGIEPVFPLTHASSAAKWLPSAPGAWAIEVTLP
jgi:hypothetical protein